MGEQVVAEPHHIESDGCTQGPPRIIQTAKHQFRNLPFCYALSDLTAPWVVVVVVVVVVVIFV